MAMSSGLISGVSLVKSFMLKISGSFSIRLGLFSLGVFCIAIKSSMFWANLFMEVLVSLGALKSGSVISLGGLWEAIKVSMESD